MAADRCLDRDCDFVERLHRTLLDEHFRVMGRKKFYESIDEMQKDLDAYLVHYNTRRPHQGRRPIERINQFVSHEA